MRRLIVGVVQRTGSLLNEVKHVKTECRLWLVINTVNCTCAHARQFATHVAVQAAIKTPRSEYLLTVRDATSDSTSAELSVCGAAWRGVVLELAELVAELVAR